MLKLAIGALAATTIIGGSLALTANRASTTDGPRVPVLVELFTSEGCSSCPPADAVLTELVESQPVAGAQVIALGEHVDYWDSLGWRDPFSQHQFSERQSDYGRHVFTSDQIYTPQMVVDGRREFVGSSMPAARRAITEAAAEAHAHVRLAISPAGDVASRLRVDVDIAPARDTSLPHADVLVALAEDGLTTSVARGENRGRTLHHTAVTRSLTRVGHVDAGSDTWTGSATLVLDPTWIRQRLHVVAFAQDRATRRVLAAADSRLE